MTASVVGIAMALALVAIPARARTNAHAAATAPLAKVVDVPMPGPAVRFDYQSFDAEHHRLYIAHMNADQLVVFDTESRKVVANLDGFHRVHGVLAVPSISRVFAAVTGKKQLAAIDMSTLKTLWSAGPITYPDGVAYAPGAKRVFVSDEHGATDAVIDAQSGKLLASIPLGGGAGNTVYDPGSKQILVAVHGRNELVAIDPATMTITARHALKGVENPHGIALDAANRLAFIAGEENHTLALFDLQAGKLLAVYPVGEDPDVLAYDPGLKRLYVSAESGTVTVLQESGRALKVLGSFHTPHAHTVSVDPSSHLVYFPLEDIGGRPILRIMRPSDQQR